MNTPKQTIEKLLSRIPNADRITGKIQLPGTWEGSKTVTLNAEWSQLFKKYEGDHQNEKNQGFHRFGIPLVAASLPTAATIVGLPLAAGMFTTGWAFQFAGHRAEGNDPSFFGDRRFLIVGALWWAKKFAGLQVNLTEAAAEATTTPEATAPVAEATA